MLGDLWTDSRGESGEDMANPEDGRQKDLEVPGGFEPPNNGFADRPLRPLGHGT